MRGGLTLVALLALAALWRTAAVARTTRLELSDHRAAQLVAAYLPAMAPLDRPGSLGADARLLSAAGTLAGASFWTGGVQVWLDGTPLLPGDSTGTDAAVATLVDPDGTVRGSVAAWETVPGRVERAMVTVSGTVAAAAIMAAILFGALARRPRAHALLVAVTLAVVLGGIVGQLRAVDRSEVAATDADLLRARRVLEVTAVGRRLPDVLVTHLAPGFDVTPIPLEPDTRDSSVSRDASGAWVVAIASRGQAWRLTDLGPASRWGEVRWRMLILGLLTLAATLAAAALPPSAGYLTESRTDPRAQT
ncbi:MAG: hypothetical protein JF590_01050 [Gemmatimonadetes bacterium]|nr:hypothetical protein [Gemmatimonadota bacterium]